MDETKDDPERLREMLWRLDMLNREAAEYLGVTERAIYWWLNGGRKIPRMVFLSLQLKESRESRKLKN